MTGTILHAVLGKRVKRLRTWRGWSLRDLAAKSGVALNSCSRAERGFALTLVNTVNLAAALGVEPSALVAPLKCRNCLDIPPAGFTCNGCQAGADPQSSLNASAAGPQEEVRR